MINNYVIQYKFFIFIYEIIVIVFGLIVKVIITIFEYENFFVRFVIILYGVIFLTFGYQVIGFLFLWILFIVKYYLLIKLIMYS